MGMSNENNFEKKQEFIIMAQGMANDVGKVMCIVEKNHTHHIVPEDVLHLLGDDVKLVQRLSPMK